MVEIRFYHLMRTGPDRALPALLTKCQQRALRAVVVAGSEERAEAYAEMLWTFDDRSFLPHGTRRDGEAERQPIWITDRLENPNDATVLFLTDDVGPPEGAPSVDLPGITLVCDLFNGDEPESLSRARERYRLALSTAHTLTYWQQDDQGRWSERHRRDGG